jgi:hypothetical protein
MLKIYTDAACTTELFGTQGFTGDGTATTFPLTNFTGVQLGIVYLGVETSYATISFAEGVGSGFSGLTVNALIGLRVIHNGTFRGTVVSNTATTVTISDTGYTEATASTAITSLYTKKVLTTDYSVSGNSIVMVVAPTAVQKLFAVPASTMNMNFGGVAGTNKVTESNIWIKRTPGYTYDTLQMQAHDLSQTQASLTQTGVTFASGVGSGFSGLTVGALKGRALNHNGVYRGKITANDATTVTISDAAYTQATTYDAVAYTIGSLIFAPDASGSPGTYAPVIHPAAVADDVARKFWVKDTITIPTSAVNYPNNIVKVTGIEYLV